MFQNNEKMCQLTECLACGSEALALVLDLHTQPLANSYKASPTEKQETFPLAINRCESCFHVQLTHAVNPDLMFKDYLYMSGTSNAMDNHFKWFANYTYEYFCALSAIRPSKVLDIGCNDGSQLNHYKNLNMMTHGVDPATNLHVHSSKKHLVYPTYFDMTFVERYHAYYDIIVAQNVFAHNYDPKAFLSAARNIMSNDSLLFIQTSQSDMILNGEFDTIYHEHISFYNVRSMRRLCERVGLYLIDVTKCPLHGNSYIFVISKNKLVNRPNNIQNLEDMEAKSGLYSVVTYTDYAKRAMSIAQKLKAVLTGLKEDYGVKIVGYGAAAKGMTLLNYIGFTEDHIDYIVDDNPLKAGMYTPGSNIEICGSSRIFLEPLDKALVFVPLAWNFYDSIVPRIKEIRKEASQTDYYVKYFPEVLVRSS